MRQLKKGDKVEIVVNGSERGMKGTVTSVNNPYCFVKISQAGQSHSTVAMIGTTRRYKIVDVKGI